jgi:hypothetical protein
MTESVQNQTPGVNLPDPQWIELYRLGFIACAAFPAFILIAVIAYFIWPYAPGFNSVAEIFTDLQTNRFAGLVSLDISKIPSFIDRLKFRLSVLFGVWSEGDHRDWDAIHAWADELPSKLFNQDQTV